MVHLQPDAARRAVQTPPTETPARATNPHKAWEWRRLRWQDEDGHIPKDALRRATAQRLANLQAVVQRGQRETAGINPALWVERGPDNVGGRTRSLLIDPDATDRMWAGAVSGGIWFSADAGATWAPVDDWLPNLAIGCLASDPNNPDVMYAGTGEGFFNGDGLGGAGIYKSVDRGGTWSPLPSTIDFGSVNRIAVSPDDSHVLLAGTTYGGIRRSTNGGLSWSNPLWAQAALYVAFDPTDGSKAVGHALDYDWGSGEWYHRAVYSIDGGLSWSTAAGLDNVPGFGARIELAHAANLPVVVYASCAADGGKVWRSLDGGQSYTPMTEPEHETGVSWYANPLWVDPTSVNTLVTGGLHFYRSTDGGKTFTRISDGYMMSDQPHVDMHLITHDPGYDGLSNRRVYVGTDGGIWKTDDITTASISGGWSRAERSYRTTQFYGAAGDGTSGLILGGTQDNGTLRLRAGSDQAHLTFGGDGGFCAIDWTDPDYCYGEYINLMIHRSTDGGQTAHYIWDGLDDADTAANFIAPFMLDPNDPATMLAGGRRLWRSTDVKAPTPTWEEISPAGSDNLSAMAVAPGDSDVIWIGRNDGTVERTANGTAGSPVWCQVDDNGAADPLPNRYVERILVDPEDSNVVYISFGGFSPDNLYRTENGGLSWQDVTGSAPAGLPEVPINGLARHPLHPGWIYVGTEVGVFATIDDGQTWSAVNEGPANASVDDLLFMHNSVTLLAATHGRGIFTVEVPGVSLLDFDVDGDVDREDFVRFDDCQAGPGRTPTPPPPLSAPLCLTAYDADADDDVDLADYAVFQEALEP